MTRGEFKRYYLGFIAQRIPWWLPEEATEEEMMKVMNERLSDHNLDIKKALLESDRRSNSERRQNSV